MPIPKHRVSGGGGDVGEGDAGDGDDEESDHGSKSCSSVVVLRPFAGYEYRSKPMTSFGGLGEKWSRRSWTAPRERSWWLTPIFCFCKMECR